MKKKSLFSKNQIENVNFNWALGSSIEKKNMIIECQGARIQIIIIDRQGGWLELSVLIERQGAQFETTIVIECKGAWLQKSILVERLGARFEMNILIERQGAWLKNKYN